MKLLFVILVVVVVNSGYGADPGNPGPKGGRGERGPQGDRGDKGCPGPQGCSGQLQCVIVPAKVGNMETTGQKGDKGDPGPPGQALKDSPLLHLVGDGKRNRRISNIEAIAVPFWKEKSKAGNITYSNGQLTIKVEGYYYIYSQMDYCEGTASLRMGHQMFINDQKVLKTTVTTSTQDTTHSVGGTFKLNKGDKITVVPLVTNKEYCFGPAEAYFGAFLVRN